MDSPAGVIKNMNDLVAAVHNVHEFLLRIPRKTHPPGGAARVRQFRGPGPNPDIFLKGTHLVEHLDPIALAVTHVHQAGVADRYTMHDPSKHTARSSLGFFLCGLSSPLTKKSAFAIKHRDPAVPIAIGDVDVTIISVYNDTGRVEELGRIGI